MASTARCGYATRHDVNTSELEDRMESFFLSETCKYLYLVGGGNGDVVVVMVMWCGSGGGDEVLV